MVLAELGGKISAAIKAMSDSVVIDDEVIDKLLNSISLALLQADVDVHLVQGLKKNIKSQLNLEELPAGNSRRRMVETTVVRSLYGLLDAGQKPYELKKGKTNVVMFVGLQGCGKTTTVAKYAKYYARKGWKVAMVCADTFRAGAFDQLKQNGIKAKIPFYGSYTERDPVIVAEVGVKQFREEKFELVIVDTSRRHKQEEALFEEMREVARVCNPDETIFVMDAHIGQAAKDQAMAFRKAVPIGSVIITKLDGHAKGGGALAAVAATASPIIFVGTGEHMDDFEKFNTQSFVSRLLGKGDIVGLIDVMEEGKIFDQKELLKKLTDKDAPGFTFRDMYEQFQNLMKLGPLSKIMSMLPGLGAAMGPGQEEQSAARIKRFMTVMDSMTNEELDADDQIFLKNGEKGHSRLRRVAIGSGSTVRHMHEVLATFIPFKRVFERMKTLGKKGMDMDVAKLTGKAGAANVRKMASVFDPQMLQRMGGVGNLQNILKEFAKFEAEGGVIPGLTSEKPRRKKR